MSSFTFNIPTKIIFGNGESKHLRYLIPDRFDSIFMVTDNNLLIKNPFVQKIIDDIKHNFKLFLFTEVEENPSFQTIAKGGSICRSESCEMVIGLGGGSSMDAAKGIAIAASNTGSIEEYIRGLKMKHDPLPVLCIPTTSGTGSEVTPFAVFTDTKNQNKCGFGHNSIFPFLSVVDPELTYSMPENIVVNTGLDVLSHAVEAYLSDLSFDMNDMYAVRAIQIVFDQLKKASIKNKNAMQAMSYASMLAGVAITHASTILPHIMGYPLTVFQSVPHGLASFLTLPAFLRFIETKNCLEDKLNVITGLIGNPDHFEIWIEKLGISNRLSSYGVKESQLELFAEKTIIKNDIHITPGDICKDDIIGIYRDSL